MLLSEPPLTIHSVLRLGCALFFWAFALVGVANAYVLEGQRWNHSPVSIQMNLSATSYRLQRPPGFPLIDGATSWESVYSASAAIWNQYMADLQINVYTGNNPNGGETGDGVNQAFFGSSLGGSSLDASTLGLTIYSYDPSTNFMLEADTAFNPSVTWNSYRGPLLASGVVDFRRVATHELGHIIGLDHPDKAGQVVASIMNSVISNIDTVTADDISGAQALYGVPSTVLPPSPVITNFISRAGDFNGDGKQDILWRNTQTGEVNIWYMNGSTVLSKDYVATVGLNWKIAGIGDFNGDGISDILWQNTVDGSFVIWIMHGDSHSDYAYPSQGNAWSITGVADLDHTGLADILWRNVVTGEVLVWRSISPLNFSPRFTSSGGLDWNIVGTADIFGNGHPALIWRNQNTGEVVVWQLSNETVVAMGSLGVVSPSWEIAGLGDFNGAGRQGILWRSTADGSVAAWLMNGFAVAPEWVHQGPVSLDWQIRATPDVYGNGVNTIWWSNATTGQQVIWVPNGAGFPGAFVGAANPIWVVQP